MDIYEYGEAWKGATVGVKSLILDMSLSKRQCSVGGSWPDVQGRAQDEVT